MKKLLIATVIASTFASVSFAADVQDLNQGVQTLTNFDTSINPANTAVTPEQYNQVINNNAMVTQQNAYDINNLKEDVKDAAAGASIAGAMAMIEDPKEGGMSFGLAGASLANTSAIALGGGSNWSNGTTSSVTGNKISHSIKYAFGVSNGNAGAAVGYTFHY